jgi:hypothetical protein
LRSKINIDSGALVVNSQFADVENYVEKLNTYWRRSCMRRRIEHTTPTI